jgi:type 1 glutamine amidotransferase
VLLRVDESTYSNNADAMGADHPISWCNEWDGGRAFYTGMGHTDGSFREAGFIQHVAAGILTAAGVAGYECPEEGA